MSRATQQLDRHLSDDPEILHPVASRALSLALDTRVHWRGLPTAGFSYVFDYDMIFSFRTTIDVSQP